VSRTANRPATTPAEVQTSVNRCLASASSATERCWRDFFSIAQASAPLSAEATIDSARPSPRRSNGCGASRRCTAAQMIASAAAKISTPSKPLEKYSALWWPKGWSSSGGRAAIVTIASANIAPARLTTDSIASDSNPTDPVNHQAPVFSAMVASATAIESLR
jgi:hypothetical protein